MLIGYISDEDDVALHDVAVSLAGAGGSWQGHSAADGAVHAEVPPGDYQLAVQHRHYGAKRIAARVDPDRPLRIRMLSDRLIGYMWPKWVRAGQTSEYCVHSTETFRLDLFRYGWDPTFVQSYGWCGEHGPRAMAQITPDGDYTQTGVQFNRTGYSLKFQKHRIRAPQQSGLYYLHARTVAGDSFSFPWIVSPASPQAKVAVLTSSTSWNAYNNFGGRSNYVNQDGLRQTPTLNSRQDLYRYTSGEVWPFEIQGAPLSFQRPEIPNHIPAGTKITDPIPGRMQPAFAPGEWRLLGWLDREGFAYDLYSDVELHSDGVPLDAYQVLILNSHPEYWSAPMYQRVKKWVHEEGGRLMYLGGCGLYAEVEFPDAQTMTCRREGECSLRGESEANLLGVAYSHGGFQSGAPYRVLQEGHWVFEGTGWSEGDRFGFQSLHERCPGGASAHELDKIHPESPAGLVHLAKGENPENSGADMTIYETPSGGAVFATGSLAWPLALPVDPGVSAVTANVLRRFLR